MLTAAKGVNILTVHTRHRWNMSRRGGILKHPCGHAPARWQSEAGDGPGVDPEKHSLIVSHLQTGSRRIQDCHSDGQPAWHYTPQSVTGTGTTGTSAASLFPSNKPKLMSFFWCNCVVFFFFHLSVLTLPFKRIQKYQNKMRLIRKMNTSKNPQSWRTSVETFFFEKYFGFGSNPSLLSVLLFLFLCLSVSRTLLLKMGEIIQ